MKWAGVLTERHAALCAAARLGRCLVGLERELDFVCEPAYLEVAPHVRMREREFRLAAAAELCAAPVTKLIVRHATEPVDALLARVRAVAGESVTATHSGAPYVEVSAAGVDKAAAVARLCQGLGIAREEVLAFGDMPNDLPLLAWAGQAYAVANAHPAVREQVPATTLANDEDGVAVVVECLLWQLLSTTA